MSGLLSFLIFGGLFFVLMRFGCGAHMSHGAHGAHEAPGAHDGHGDHDSAARGGAGAPEQAATDPVCGMLVAAGQGYVKNYEGRALHFCSRKCLDKFEATPQRYAA